MSFRFFAAAAAGGLVCVSAPIAAQEVFAGVYVHEVDTPFSLPVNEGGADIQLGYRWEKQEGLSFIGKPEPYVMGSLNTDSDTSYVAAGLSWKIGKGPVFVRPGLGIAVHDGPDRRIDPVTLRRTDMGSRVVFAPEIGVGAKLSDKWSVEASWVHLSHARIFDSDQNPGIDMMGARVTYRFD